MVCSRRQYDLGGAGVRVGIVTPNMISVRATDTLSVLSPCMQTTVRSTTDFMIYIRIYQRQHDTCISLSFLRKDTNRRRMSSKLVRRVHFPYRTECMHACRESDDIIALIAKFKNLK
jgi:hypothetical protein